MAGTPKISVLMPVYNGEKYVERAVKSILDQTFEEFELIIGDDGSTDNTVAVINSIDDDRISLFSNDRNRGIVYTRNKLFEMARANYLAIIDCDDISYPGRLEAQYNFFQANPDVTICGTGTEVIDSNDNVDRTWKFKNVDHEIKVEFMFGNHMVTSSVMINKEASPIDLLFDDNYPVSEDFHLWARIAEASGKFHILPQILTQYRGHEDGISKTQRDLIERKIYSVVVYQLNILFDDFSERDNELHFALSNNKPLREGLGPKDMLYWVERVIKRNRECGRLQDEQFTNRMFDYLFDHLSANVSLVPSLTAILRTNELNASRKWYYIKSLLNNHRNQ